MAVGIQLSMASKVLSQCCLYRGTRKSEARLQGFDGWSCMTHSIGSLESSVRRDLHKNQPMPVTASVRILLAPRLEAEEARL